MEVESVTGGVHEGQLHGVPDEGNEGRLFAWFISNIRSMDNVLQSKSLSITAETPMDRHWLVYSVAISRFCLVDVCATISQYFRGVNVPLESVGKVLSN